MARFLSAHGYDPGPTQRPALAGGITCMLATLPATVILVAFGSLEVEARILGLSVIATLAAGWFVMGVAGAAYGRLFQRAANDRRGGWLFGMAFGFLLWAAGAVMLLPAVSGGAAPGGEAAIGVFLSLLAWGAALGSLFPFVHRRLHARADGRAAIGPSAAASREGQLRRS